MAASIDNAVTITGNVTRDPELRFTPAGVALASFGIAYNTRRRLDDGSYEDGDPHFFDVTCWRQMAENVAESVQRGDRVSIVGRLEYRAWETDAGEKRSKVQIVADEVGINLRFVTVPEKVKTSGGSKGGGGTAAAYAPPPDEEPF